MQTQKFTKVTETTKTITRKTASVLKVAMIVVMTTLTLFGAYTAMHTSLRNAVIDSMQNQSPKG